MEGCHREGTQPPRCVWVAVWEMCGPAGPRPPAHTPPGSRKAFSRRDVLERPCTSVRPRATADVDLAFLFLVVAANPRPPWCLPRPQCLSRWPGTRGALAPQEAGSHVEVRVAPGRVHGEPVGQGALGSPGFGKTAWDLKGGKREWRGGGGGGRAPVGRGKCGR